MKDFKDRKLYDMEVGLYDKFLRDKLTTKSEYNKFDDGTEEEELMETSVLGFGDSFDDDSGFGGLTSGGGFDDFGGFDSFGGFGDATDTVNYDDWKQETGINKFLKSPIFLSKYVFNSLLEEKVDDSGNKTSKLDLDLDHAKDFFKYVGCAGSFLLGTSILGVTLGFNTLHNNYLGLATGALSILGGSFFNWLYFNQGIISKFKPNENPKAELMSTSEDNQESEFGGMEDFSFGEDSENMEDFSFGDDSEVSKLSLMDDFQDDSEEFEDDDYEEDSSRVLGVSDVDTSDDYVYKQGLIREFQKNARYQGRYLETRKETLDSFAGLLLNNDKSFTKWKHERERSIIYNNIAYTLYKALIDINGQFAKDEKEKVTIMSIMYSPLLYKIELKLPQKYFGGDKLQRGIRNFENHLKRDAADTEVQCMVSMSGDTFIIRLLRLDYKGLISIGDILRYKDDGVKGTAYEQLTNPKANTPMLVGLKDNEYPHVVDLEKNTAMAIVGGSGSGKSWLTYELGTNIITTNDFNEVNFIVLDLKNAPFWQSFARMPHVIGYHAPNPPEGYTNKDFLEDALKISAEVVQECYRRQAYLNEVEMEDAIEARTTYKKNKQYGKLKEMPLLIFCIDEITSTMNELEEDKEMFESFRNNLKVISQIGRSAGVRLLTVGQRAIDKSLPKNVRANTTLLFGMKMNAQSDFGMLFEGSKEVENMPKPTGAGQGIINSEDILGFHSLKTLTPGGKDTPQIRMLLRVMAFDWLRRASGREDLVSPPIGTKFEVAYNRPKFLELSYSELREGKLFNKVETFPEVAIDLTGKNPVINQYKNVLEHTEDKVKTETTNDFSDLAVENEIVEPDEDNLNNLDLETLGVDDIIQETTGEVSEFSDTFDTEDNDEEYEDYPELNYENNKYFEEYEDIVEESPKIDSKFSELVEGEDLSESIFNFLQNNNKETETDNFEEDDSEATTELELELYGIEEDTPTSVDENETNKTESFIEGSLQSKSNGKEINIEEDNVFDWLSGDDDESLPDSQEEISEDELETIRKEKERMQEEMERELAIEKAKLEQEQLRIQKEAMEKELELERAKIEKEKLKLQKEALAEKEKLERELEQTKQELVNKQKETPKVESKVSNPNVVSVGYNSTANTIKHSVDKPSIKNYIIENGSKVSGDFSWAVAKNDIESSYTKAEIKRAIAIGDILEANDSYVTSL